MPIIIPSTTASTVITAQNVLDSTIAEVQNSFPNTSLALTYVDRIQREIVRRRRWDWMRSAVQQFVTSIGQTQYWIGPTGGNSVGQVDTGLNLTDIYEVEVSSVLDRSGFTDLARWSEFPISTGLTHSDNTFLLDQPRWFRTDRLTPNLLAIGPAPMKFPDYLMLPEPPLCTTAVSGSLPARTYYVTVTFVDSSGGESVQAQKTTQIFVPANSVLVVHPPQPGVTTSGTGVSYNQYKVYASATSGSEQLQSSAVSTGSTWQEPDSGLVAGVAPPTSATIAPLNGFLIQFRYFKKITQVVATTDTLLIPVRYLDVVVAGVNWLGAQSNAPNNRYDKKAADWFAIYNAGIISMIRDQNPYPGTETFIRPDVDTRWPWMR